MKNDITLEKLPPYSHWKKDIHVSTMQFLKFSILFSQTTHDMTFKNNWLTLSCNKMTTTKLTVLTHFLLLYISSHRFQAWLDFEPIWFPLSALTDGLDFFFSTFLYFLGYYNTHTHPPYSTPWDSHYSLFLVSLPSFKLFLWVNFQTQEDEKWSFGSGYLGRC